MLVAGATGGVGEEIVRALASREHLEVVAASRSESRLAALMARLHDVDTSRITPLIIDLSNVPVAAAAARRLVEAGGPFDVAIASLGGWWQGGPLLEVDDPTWHSVLDEMLGSHFIFARAFLPELTRKPGGLYLGIGGGAALFPVRDSSLVSIAAAGQLMLTRALAQELRAVDVEIVELVVNGPVRTPEWEAVAGPDWITAADVGRVVAEFVHSRTLAWPRIERDGPLILMHPDKQ